MLLLRLFLVLCCSVVSSSSHRTSSSFCSHPIHLRFPFVLPDSVRGRGAAVSMFFSGTEGIVYAISSTMVPTSKHGVGGNGAGVATGAYYAGVEVGFVCAASSEEVVDPTYSGYEAPNGGGTAA